MALHARHAIALAMLIGLAGCAGTLGESSDPTAPDVEPKLVGVSSSGGRCVAQPMHGFDNESTTDDGIHLVTVAGNVTVPAANYALDETNLTRTGPRSYRLDVNTARVGQKPDRECPNGGIVRYEATAQLPDDDGFELAIYHDGVLVSGIGAGES